MAYGIRTSGSTSSRIRARSHSAIGTHRLSPRPLQNILYPYHRQYKSIYRSPTTRTATRFPPVIDRYPWQSHPKRFHGLKSMRISIFSDYLNRNRALMTLMELLHTLPLYGVNSVVWKINKTVNATNTSPELQTTVASGRVLNVNGSHYMVDDNARNDQYYHIRNVDHTIRPFRARVSGDLYTGENLVRQDVSPIGSVRGEWRHAHPLNEGSSATLSSDPTMDQLAEGLANLQIYRPNVEGPFRNMVPGTVNF